MRKLMLSLAAVTVAASAAQTFAAPSFPTLNTAYNVDVFLYAPTSTTWQVWAIDTSNTADKGIDLLGFTLTPSSGTVSCPSSTGITATEDTVDSPNSDLIGFSAAGSGFGNNKASLTIGVAQQASAGTFQQNVDSAVFGVGQSASALNNNGSFLGYTCPDGTVIASETNTHAASNTISGWVELFAGTNNVAGSVTGPSNFSGLGVDMFDNTQPLSAAGQYSTAANLFTGSMVVLAAPEPATLALLAFGGLLALPRRRHA